VVLNIISQFIKKERNAVIVLFAVSLVLAFVRFEQTPISDWDEARQGVNALQMIKNGDYVNLYYEDGQLDTWNAKPPLLIWCIVFCFNFFGKTEFALRLPSLIAGICYLFVSYKILRLYKGVVFSFLTCLALMCCKALFAWHIACSADFDSLLLLFLNLSVYCFLLYIDFGKKYAILGTAMALGLAFYAKGPASVVLLPGMLVYLLVRKSYTWIFRSWQLYGAVLIFALMVSSWVTTSIVYGKKYENDKFYAKSNNNLEVLFYEDVVGRFTSSKDFDKNIKEEQKHDYWFVFLVIDSRLNVWNYILYLSIILGLYLNRTQLRKFLGSISYDSNRLVVISLCLALPLSLFLTMVCNANNWYLAPAFFYFMILIVAGGSFITRVFPVFKYVIVLVVLFTGIRNFIDLAFPSPTKEKIFVVEHLKTIESAKKIILVSPTQSMFLYMKMNCNNVKIFKNGDRLEKDKNVCYVYYKQENWVLRSL
jgi:4-amino-4-deoxy-L-arabinose transferase-like glycosyltransferase